MREACPAWHTSLIQTPTGRKRHIFDPLCDSEWPLWTGCAAAGGGKRTEGSGSFEALWAMTKATPTSMRLGGGNVVVTRNVEDPRLKFKAFPLRLALQCKAVSCPLGPCMRACRRAEGSWP
jgi:hypothetical protein